MLIHYWCPFLTNIATISSVKRSAISLKRYTNSTKVNIEIINCYGEWSNTKKLNNDNIIIKNPLTGLNLFKILPKKKFFSKISLSIIFILSFFPLLLKIKKEKPNYLIIHLLTSLPIILSPFIFKNTKIILRISGLPKLNYFRKLIWKLFGRNIYLITTPTRITKQDLINSNIFENSKIQILRDPVINVADINIKKREIINDLRFNKNDFYLAIGRLTKQKNFLFLVKVFSKLVKNLKTRKLCILGSGEEEDKLKNLIKKHKMEKNIFLLGYQKNPYKFINSCKAVISTSLYEDPGFVLVESFFLNKPVISSNSINGPKEMSLENNIGFFFKTNDPDDFKKKINEFENQNNVDKILNAKKFSKNFSLFRHYKNISSLLK